MYSLKKSVKILDNQIGQVEARMSVKVNYLISTEVDYKEQMEKAPLTPEVHIAYPARPIYEGLLYYFI